MDVSAVFSTDGPLAREIPGFSPRQAQLRMADAVAGAFEDDAVLVVEAGTGTGKTFAYLVPALLSGHRTIISTGTRHLQDQLFHRDLPLVRRALEAPVDIALLKGRANYLCLHRLGIAEQDGRLPTRPAMADLEIIRRWARVTESGDTAELADVAEESPVWPMVTSTTDNCLGADCSFFQQCHVVRARRRAQEAEVLVINHHLLFADMALKEEGFGELLPGAGAFVIDEAHQLPAVASQFFGISLTSRQLLGIARDAVLEHLREAGDMRELPATAGRLETAVRDLRLAFPREIGRSHWHQVAGIPAVSAALQGVETSLRELTTWLKAAASRGRGLENCGNRATLLMERLHLVREPPKTHIHWLETSRRGFGIHFTPFEVASHIRSNMQALGNTWVFTSATLSVNGDFKHYVNELGIESAQTANWASPFDFEKQGLLYVPQKLPEPNTPDYTRAVVEAALPVVEASRGRAFLLFTSLRAMREAHGLLIDEFKRRGWDYPLLAQGEGSRTELLQRFRTLGNAVLVGSQSFWEGVDVRGDALSLVMIDKLPFAPPDDPVLAARIEKINAEGRNAFMEYQLPRAVISLKQGAGRLIRDETDRGVLMICDPRLISKAYGKRIWRSLPPMTRTRDLADVVAFFSREPVTPEAVA